MNNNKSYATGSLIEKLRKESNLTLQKMAEGLHVSKAAICQWEGGSGIKTEMLYKIAKYFDITVDELLNGKLNSETNADYWKRNFDLNNFDFDEDISENNINQLETFYKHIQLIKSEFYRLLPSWANNSLNDIQLEEFEFLKKNYFKFDSSYYEIVKFNHRVFYFPTEKEIKQFVLEIHNKNMNKNPEEYEWEISKLFGFTVDYKGEKVCNSGLSKALELYLGVLNPVQKDELLDSNLIQEYEEEVSIGFSMIKQKKIHNLTDDEIEARTFFKTMLNNGCHCMLKYRSNVVYVDKENIDCLEGRIAIVEPSANEIFENNHLFINLGGLSRLNALEYWKFYSLQEYKTMIDKEKTEKLFYTVNYKNDDPLTYYRFITKNKYFNKSKLN